MIFKTSLAIENWGTKYRYNGETQLQTWIRVSKAIAEVESKYGADSKTIEYWSEQFLKALVKFEEVPQGTEGEDIYVDKEGRTYRATGLNSTPGGRITANAGTEYEKATILNCFINSPVTKARIEYTKNIPNTEELMECFIETEDTPDNLTNIFLTLLEAAETLKSEGGYGMNFGFIRPRSSLIEGVGIRHPGVVTYMELWDKMSGVIVQGDNDGYEDSLQDHLKDETQEALAKVMPRKGAMMAVLPIWHPDIEEFIRAKQTQGRLTKFNISVLIDDRFMEAVEKDEMYDLHFNGTTYKRVKAAELYELIMQSTYNRNEPGILFLDNMNRQNPLIYLGPVTASNPCGEVPGTSYMDKHYEPADYLKPYMGKTDEHLIGFTTVCLLGSINLTQFVREDRTFDFESYRKVIEIKARMLDNVNDIGNVPLPAYKWALENVRQYGMGVNGLGSTLYMMGIRYGGDEGNAFVKEIHRIKDDETMRVSALLAKERGTFSMYSEEYLNTPYFKEYTLASESTKDLVRKYGLRNGKRLTNPPLGNSSVICDGISNGIEPVFSHGYQRTVITDEWPEGLNQDNVKEILTEIQVGDATAWQGEYEGRTYYYEPHNRGLCFIEDVEDYGYAWVRDNFPEDIGNNDYMVTAQDLKVLEHVKVQALVQEGCDQSVSKCLVKGQIVETNLGPMKIEDFLEGEHEEEGFYKAKQGVSVYGPDGKLVSVKRAYYGGVKPSYYIRTTSGEEIRCSDQHRFKTQRGWVRARDLKKEDFILSAEMEYQHGKGGLALDFDVETLNLHYYNEITIPTHMTPDLAEFLGMIAADGHLTHSTVSLIEKNEAVGDRFHTLSQNLFGRTPNLGLDKRNGVKTHTIRSRPLSEFVSKLLKGKTSFTTEVPDAVMFGSKAEKIAFMSGVTLDGYYVGQGRGKFCLYGGSSLNLAQGIQRIARQVWGNVLNTEKKLTSSGNYSYIVKVDDVTGLHPAEPHKILALKGDDYVSVDLDYLRQKNGLNYKNGVQIAEILYIGEYPVYDIEVDAEHHSYLVEGLISHNTCNVPNDYLYEDFKDLYKEAWKANLIGFTTYRVGTMESVLSVAGNEVKAPSNANDLLDLLKKTGCVTEDAEITEEGVIVRNVRLPEEFSNGRTVKVKAEHNKYYMHFSYLPEDDRFPIAMWIHSNEVKSGEYISLNRAIKAIMALLTDKGVDKELVQNQFDKTKDDFYHVRFSKVISMALRHNIPVLDIVNALTDIEGDYIASTLSAARRFLSEHVPEGTLQKGKTCHDCGSDQIIVESGCDRCLACGSSSCG